ncbi:glycosyltransferase family 61 protein [Defluviimonas sp. WL0002]|uniref:Glycosyltransferase family 61 protein n=1 Tax=Albidovulum marisflavi TaxID=2984159 RepID=A0ABT2ZED6_9RHOB|nr:glycosyltransferase family 61 protein [Defluviimonas sp. WL0002]MCV2869495.1 glycosyltransferase family 61 protein [Defluviimonas sp. WL0002]
MISVRPALSALGIGAADLFEVADERWEIAPACPREIRPGIALSGQFDRIRGTEFRTLEQVQRELTGGYVETAGPTFGFRLKDVDLVDGVLYSAKGIRHLRQRSRWRPTYVEPQEVASGALYESWWGNRWFGNWLSDDCPRYSLAKEYGKPVCSSLGSSGHVPDYEARLEIAPLRLEKAHFRELLMFDDFTKNDERRGRAEAMRAQLVAAVPHESHPGVFLTRGTTGEARVLANETEIAAHLESRHGFRVLDPATSTVEAIIAACAGARVVAGVEGSHLVHGLAVMPPGSALFVIQPPARVTSVLKFVTDRQGMDYAYLVATGPDEAFTASIEEVDQTLDLLMAGGHKAAAW